MGDTELITQKMTLHTVYVKLGAKSAKSTIQKKSERKLEKKTTAEDKCEIRIPSQPFLPEASNISLLSSARSFLQSFLRLSADCCCWLL